MAEAEANNALTEFKPLPVLGVRHWRRWWESNPRTGVCSSSGEALQVMAIIELRNRDAGPGDLIWDPIATAIASRRDVPFLEFLRGL